MKPIWRLSASLAFAAAVCAIAQTPVTVPESFALPAGSVDLSKPGFKVRVAQATTADGTLPNSSARANAQLAGLYLNPLGQPYQNLANLAGFNPDGTYDEGNVISYAAGTFPGIPGTENATDNIAVEAITFVQFASGTYEMVINSDDGFLVSIGNVYDRLEELPVGVYEGGRGAADTTFQFTIQRDGVYPMRLLYYQGNGGHSVDWFVQTPGDPNSRVSLNAGTLKAYRALTTNPRQRPTLVGITPPPNATGVSPSTPVQFKIVDGITALVTSSVKVMRNGIDVTTQASVSKSGDTTLIKHTTSTLPAPLEVIEYVVSFNDTATPANTRNITNRFTVAAYANYTLPLPIVLQTFDNTLEGELPAGWTVQTPIEGNGVFDLTDPGSDSYLNWVVISRQRVIDNGTRWDTGRRLVTPEAYINGQRITSLMNGNFIYGESDVRGGNQIQYLFSPEFNLTGKSNVYVVFHSAYEQNQDSMGALEFSINGGTTWLPIVYMLDVPDIALNPDGTINAEATFTNLNADTATYIDPQTGEEKGDTYGAFIGASRDTWKDLGPYISGRINDDPAESKRIEKYRLLQADNQARVSFRFAHIGTGSWYWGVDDFGLYEITTIDPPSLTQQPTSITRIAGSTAEFTVGVSGQQLSYQWQKNQQNIASANSATFSIAAVAAADAGAYRCVITNAAGSVTSAEATLTVLDVPSDAASLRQGLAAYLPLDSDYNDASGNNRNGSAVGTPQLVAGQGKVGGAVRVTSNRANTSFNFVTLGSNANLPFGQTSDFTVAFWVKPERVDGDPSIVANKNWGSGGNTGWTLGTQTDGRVEWNYKRDTGSRKDLDSAGGKLPIGQWRHVVVVWSINEAAKTYVNGELIDTRNIGPGSGSLRDDTLSLNLGQDGTGAYTDGEFDGLIDDVAFWNRSLTDTEVTTLYGYGLFGDSFYSSPAITQDLGVHLKFEGNYSDSSPNGANAAAVGAPSFVAGKTGQQGVRVNTDRPNTVFNYVTLGNTDKVRFGETKDFTVSFWVKAASWAGDPAFVSNKDWGSGGNTGWVIATDSDGRLQWNYKREGQTRKDFDSLGGLFSDNRWHHVTTVFQINGQSVTYFDGVEITTDRGGAAARKELSPGTGTLFPPALKLNIGQDGTGAYTDSDLLDAVIDDVAIWNRVLSSREVAVIFSKGTQGASFDETPQPPAPAIDTTVEGNQLTLSWSGTGYRVQETTTLGNPAGWSDTPNGAASPVTVTISATGNKFYRLIK